MALNITFVGGANVAVLRGTNLFTGAFTAEYATNKAASYEFDNFGDSEYVYLIVKSKTTGADV